MPHRPLEGLKERVVWAGVSLQGDLLAEAVAKLVGGLSTLQGWLESNPKVQWGAGGAAKAKIFDATESLDTEELLTQMAQLRVGA